MKRKEIVLLLSVVFTSVIYSQQGWFSLNRIASGNHFKSVCFANDSVGYAVSNEGSVFITNDFGNSWSELHLTDGSLNDITFIEGNGYLVGDKGKIFKTNDGLQWVEKNSMINTNLSSVYFLDADTGYAFGDFSTILKTTDGGETWISLNLNSGLQITDAAFATPAFGLCATAEGYIIRTLDYGKSWQYLYIPYETFVSVFFTDENTAYITGFENDVGVMLKTTDKGNTFEHIYPGTLALVTGSYFTNKDTGYVIGTGGYISKTTNAGASWQTIFCQSDKNFNSLFFTDLQNGYIVGNDSTILKTTDGGESWELKGSGFTSNLNAVSFPGSNTGYAAGEEGEIYKIENDSVSLIQRIGVSQPYNDLNFIYFIDSLNGFTGGYNGKFFTTTDGGFSWTLTDFRPQDVITMWAIKFYRNQIGIVAAGDKLLKTTDAGKHWDVINSNTTSTDVALLNKDTLISVGWNGKIFKSFNGGDDWTNIDSPTNNVLWSVDFIDSRVGFAVGRFGTILKTTDGGENWFTIESDTTETFTKVYFLNSSKGYIIGSKGVMLFTNDGGTNWELQKSNTRQHLNDLCFVNDTTGYIVGTNGTILKTINGGTVGVKRVFAQRKTFSLFQNYPNPFNPSTVIKFTLKEDEKVTLKIFDILGREVTTLLNRKMKAGVYSVNFNATGLSAGVYFYRITAGNFVDVKKMILLK